VQPRERVQHDAHELVDERGRHVGLIHRDISPQNILVGTDGTARVADFGVAKIATKVSRTKQGMLKGKLAYMPPEYLNGEAIDRRFDVFSAGVVLWEALAGRRLFRGENQADTFRRVIGDAAEPLAVVAPQAAALDGVLSMALTKSREERFATALAMANALESAATPAGLCARHSEVAACVAELAGPALEERRAKLLVTLPEDSAKAREAATLRPPQERAATAAEVAPTVEIPAAPKPVAAPPATLVSAGSAPKVRAAEAPTANLPARVPKTVPLAAAPRVAGPNAAAPITHASNAHASNGLAPNAPAAVAQSPIAPSPRSLQRVVPLWMVLAAVAAIVAAGALVIAIAQARR
jgi:serine/threonine-protein kinase